MITLVASEPKALTVNIATRSQGLLPVEIAETETIADLKKKVQQADGTPVRAQLLCFEGKELKDHNSLRDYCIGHEATVPLVTNPRQLPMRRSVRS